MAVPVVTFIVDRAPVDTIAVASESLCDCVPTFPAAGDAREDTTDGGFDNLGVFVEVRGESVGFAHSRAFARGRTLPALASLFIAENGDNRTRA
jgi:hypothetical protein